MRNLSDFIRTVRRPYPPLYPSLLFQGMAEPDFYRDFLGGKQFATRDCIQLDFYFYYAQKDLDAVGQAAFTAWSDPDIFSQASKECFVREKALLAAAEGDDFTRFCRAYTAYVPTITLVWQVDSLVEFKMRAVLAGRFPAQEVNTIMDQLNVPFEDNFYKKEMYDLAQASDLHAHVQQYVWLKSRYGARVDYTLEEAYQKKSEMDAEKLLEDRQKEKLHLARYLADMKKTLGADGHWVDVMQFIIFYRTQRTDIINRASYVFAPTLAQIAQQRGVSYDQILHATASEITGGLPDARILESRQQGFAVVMDDGVMRCQDGVALRDLRSALQRDFRQVPELSGVAAYRGCVRGRAKVILSMDDFGKFSDGDIIVTTMTSPNFLPLMKRAAGFITDEGGITCHAAIISRELRKPCIIATRTATDVFHDGDLVELDATAGLVKKLE